MLCEELVAEAVGVCGPVGVAGIVADLGLAVWLLAIVEVNCTQENELLGASESHGDMWDEM